MEPSETYTHAPASAGGPVCRRTLFLRIRQTCRAILVLLLTLENDTATYLKILLEERLATSETAHDIQAIDIAWMRRFRLFITAYFVAVQKVEALLTRRRLHAQDTTMSYTDMMEHARTWRTAVQTAHKTARETLLK